MMRVFVYEHFTGSTPADGEVDADLLGAGRAMRDAVVGDLLRCGDCAVTVAAGAGESGVTNPWARAVRPAEGASMADFLAMQARLHDGAWVIAPETGGVLGRSRAAVGDARWLGCSAGAIALTTSKSATLARAAEHGVTTPLAFQNDPETRRWVVKPDDGAGAVASRVHATLAAASAEASMRQRRGESATLEAWVEGEPLSLSLLCGPERVELLSVNRQDIGIDRDGILSFGGVQIVALAADEARFAGLQRWATSLANAIPGLRGYVGVDLVWHPQHGPVLIEINPRVTMAYPGLSAALGRNLAAAVLALHTMGRADASA